MKKIYLLLSVLFISLQINTVFAQDEEVELLYHWSDSTFVGSFCAICGNGVYNEVWGFVQDGREYGVIGSTAGANIFDLTDPSNIKMIDFIPGAYHGEGVVHRDFHDYNGYLYMVCDQGLGISGLQIADLSYLPDSVHVVYSSNELFSMAHNIFIDTTTAKLYVCSAGHNDETIEDIEVYYLGLDPINPILIQALDMNEYVHDVYVRNDIAYLNVGYTGLFIVDFSPPVVPEILGSLTEYSTYGQGYNHSGWLNDAGDIYVFADETHGVDIKVVDVTDFSDMKVLSTFTSGVDPKSIAHNLIIKDNYVYVSYYHDGLQIFDISDPSNPELVRIFDTFSGDHAGTYEGAWGVYPYLPSGIVLISDMQSGFYVFDPKLPNSIADVKPIVNPDMDVKIATRLYNNDLSVQLNVKTPQKVTFELYDITGQQLFQQQQIFNQIGNFTHQIPMPSHLPTGYIIAKVSTQQAVYSQKVLNLN